MNLEKLEQKAKTMMGDLALGRLTPAIILTPQQQACGISAHLAYIASLVIPPSKVPPYSNDEEQMFARLQLLYRLSLRTEDDRREQPHLFKLSPLFTPVASSPKERDVAATTEPNKDRPTSEQTERKGTEREKLLKELLAAEEGFLKKKRDSKNVKRRKSRAQQRNRNDPRGGRIVTNSSESKEDGGSSETLEALLSCGISTNSEDTDAASSSEHEEGHWIRVKPPRSANALRLEIVSVSASERREAIPKQSEMDRLPNDNSVSVCEPKRVSSKNRKPCHEEAGTELPPLVNCVTPTDTENDNTDCNMLQPPKQPQPSISPSHHHLHPPGMRTMSVDTLKEQILKLQIELYKKDGIHAQKLDAERRHHRATLEKALRLEREKCDTQLQALQLRLYISDTRLLTLEDALEQHVDAVAHLPKRYPSEGLGDMAI